MVDVLETIKNMIRQGASSDEIVESLRAMGIAEEEARRLILLAEREMLRVLRNEIREIAKDAFIEQAEEMKKELQLEVNKAVDIQMKLAKKNLTELIRKEINRYVSTVSRLEDRVSLIERKLYDIEDSVARLESSVSLLKTRWSGRSIKGLFFRYVLPFIGIALLLAAVIFSSADKTFATYLFLAGIFFVIGGVFLGR
ncbi:MAG TPA: hypothetical protein EYH14_02530 [Euryarchaeota archaeon]|nr:hypothetical protein [Euryarchaeota archaeon]